MSEYLQLQSEMMRMDLLLKSIRRQSSSLLVDSELGNSSGTMSSKRKALSLQQKRDLSASSWAKSSTKKEYVQPRSHNASNHMDEDVSNEEDVVDLVAADRYVKTSAPRYTMGHRYSDSIDRGRGRGRDEAAAALGQYEPSIDKLSTSKRPRVCTFSTTPRPFTTSEAHTHRTTTITSTDSNYPATEAVTHTDGEVVNTSTDDASTSKGDYGPRHLSYYPQPRPSKGVHRFGKQSRFTPVITSHAGSDLAPMLDLERAERAILPHSSSVQFMLPVHKRRPPEDNDDEQPHLDSDSKSPIIPDMNSSSAIDGLSYRTRVTNITSMRSRRRTSPIEDVPGPGSYSYRVESLSTHRRASSACRYHRPVQLRNSAALTHKLRYEQDLEAQIGPGAYHPDKGYEVVSYKTPVLRIHPAESKSTPQLQRRAYFEQKARDMREAHDFMKDSSIAVRGVNILEQLS